MNRSESIAKISAALVTAQSAMGNASKGANNPFFKSKYADLNAIREACIPILNANKITVLQPTTVVDGKAYVETILLHESGELLSSLTEIISPKQNDPQAHGSGVSYARRYGLQSFLCIGAEDDDGEKAMGRNVPAAKPTVVKTNSVNGQPQNILSNGKAETVTASDSLAQNAESAPVKKGGFGVKKETEVKKEETSEEWS